MAKTNITDHTPQGDLEIMKAIAKGNKVAFKNFYDAHAKMVYNVAYSYSNREDFAQEISQEVFVKIFKYAKNFQGNAKLTTWVYRIVINTSLTLLEKEKKNNSLRGKQRFLPSQLTPDSKINHDESKQTLYKAIDLLAKNQRTAFILAFVEEHSRQDIADFMELSIGAVESLLQRAKQNLRKTLADFYNDRRKLY